MKTKDINKLQETTLPIQVNLGAVRVAEESPLDYSFCFHRYFPSTVTYIYDRAHCDKG